MMRWLWVAVCVLAAVAAPAAGGDGVVRVGVLAYRGAEEAKRRWESTVRYLSRRLGGRRFELVPYGLSGLERAVARHEVDFVLTNPGHYVVLEAAYGVTRIATLRNRVGPHVLTRFGAVVFTRADHPTVRSLTDLPGHSFLAVAPGAFGGFQMAWRRLRRAGVDPFRDLRLRFVGFPQDAIVREVLAGRADAGTVRTDILERMAAEGGIDLARVRVLGARTEPGFPFRLSTRLYPEWPFSRLASTPEELAREVVVALLTLPSDAPEATAAGTAGWTIPLDYTPVHELYRELGIGPYAQTFTVADVVRRYAPWLLAGGLAVLALAAVTAWALRLNRVLAREVAERRRAELALARHRDLLEQRVAERTADLRRLNERLARDVAARERAERALRRSDALLRRMHAILSTPGLDGEGRVTRLLEALCRYGGLRAGVVGRLHGEVYEACAVAGEAGVAQGARWPLAAVPAAEVVAAREVVAGTPRGEGPLARWPFRIGAPVRLGDEVRCVVELFGEAPALTADMDRDLLRLVAQWIAAELARSEADERLRRHREELAHVGRVSAAGEMATALAHELNQPLTAVVNYVAGSLRRLRRDGALDPAVARALERAMAEAERAGRVVRHLREFVRKAPAREEGVTDVNEAVRVVLELVAPEAGGRGVGLRARLAPALPPVAGGRIQIEQVVLNLVRNAVEAAAGGRRREVIVSTVAADEGVEIHVEDTGPGLDAEVRAHLFEPFFTTRPEGMGMGLSIARGIVEALGGRIRAADRPLGGAVFTVVLPGRGEDG